MLEFVENAGSDPGMVNEIVGRQLKHHAKEVAPILNTALPGEVNVVMRERTGFVAICSLLVATLLLFGSSVMAEAAVEATASFPNVSVPLIAQADGFMRSPEPATLTGFLFRPEGAGPFPALVLLHGCDGLHRDHEFHWAQWFQGKGYVALVVDSLSPRRIGQEVSCNSSTQGAHFTSFDRSGDALGALAYLRSLPYVDAGRVGVVGWSQGAGAALVAQRQEVVDATHMPGGGFKVVVAFYPPCLLLIPGVHIPVISTDIHVPLFLILGGTDKRAPPEFCQATASQLKQQGATVRVQVFPGAPHAFDFAGPGYDPIATDTSEKLVELFLGQYLQ